MKKNKKNLARKVEKIKQAYSSSALVEHEVARRLIDKIDLLKVKPKKILNLGSADNYFSGLIQKKYANINIINIDICESMLGRDNLSIAADCEQLPIQANSIDCVAANFVWHWLEDPVGFLDEALRVLKPGGLLLFTTYGPDTLYELRQAYAGLDKASHLLSFIDMHHIGDALQKSRFEDPVTDVEYIQLQYESVKQLLQDLKQSGSINISADRPQGLKTAKYYRALEATYQDLHSEEGKGQFPASFEIITALAWKPIQASQRKNANGEISVPISSIIRRS